MNDKVNMKGLMQEVDTTDVLDALQKQRKIEADVNLLLHKTKTDKYSGIKFIINEKNPQDHTELGFFKKKIRELYDEIIDLKKSNNELVQDMQSLSINNEFSGSNDDLLKIINDLKKEKEKYLEDELKRIENEKEKELETENYKKEIILKIGENISHFFPDYESKIQNKIKEEIMKNMKSEFENQFIKKLEIEKAIIVKENEKKMEDYKKNIKDNHKEEFKKQLDILKNLKNNNVVESKSPVVESKPPVVESKPPVVEHNPVNKSNVTTAELFSLIANSRLPKPPVVETKPPVVETKLHVVETKLPVVESNSTNTIVVKPKTKILPPPGRNIPTYNNSNISSNNIISTSKSIISTSKSTISTSKPTVSTSKTGNVSTVSKSNNPNKKNRRVIAR